MGGRARSRLPGWWPAPAAALSLVVGALVGWGAGAVMLATSDPADGWADLAAVVVGQLVGVVVTIGVWVAVVVRAAWVLYPRGRRLRVVLVSLGAAVATVVGASAVLSASAVGETVRLETAGVVILVTVLVVPVVTGLLFARHTRVVSHDSGVVGLHPT
ncbi:hypothetical protein [Actinotalea sp. K2]|uniref:hypothetical protein n=1 Tax=Actinotalea sp. K2 TaxID=2939438 RepID=UPI002016E77B|nr:hypothetical protein [Actinotalea sp. K2]MCL3860957.1 hypothetical protein [Actinotalea sp. K2]